MHYPIYTAGMGMGVNKPGDSNMEGITLQVYIKGSDNAAALNEPTVIFLMPVMVYYPANQS